MCESIRAAGEGHTFRSDSVTMPVTVSMGGAHCSEKVESATALLKAADENLYRAKEAGRNQFCDG